MVNPLSPKGVHNMEIKRGQIYICDFGETVGSVQSGLRPCVVIQNDKGNYFSPTIIVAPITSKSKRNNPTSVHQEIGEGGLAQSGEILCNQIQTVSKEQLATYIGTFAEDIMRKVNRAIKISLGV